MMELRSCLTNNGEHMATAILKLPTAEMPSQMKVHLRDIPGQPVLLSARSLRALGAVIDFERNEAIFSEPTRDLGDHPGW